ncbi:MAG: hypothetical protein GWP50_04340 [Proteobacteria bacterium]|nr:hypothetical protein [Pseudomonadota bacterium]
MSDTKFSSGFCKDCNKEVLLVAEAPSHPVWFLIGVTTFIVFFIWWYLSSQERLWRCCHCGVEQDPEES